MKQMKHALIIMLLCLIYISIIEEIKSSSLKNLYYSNAEITKGKAKAVAAKKSKAVAAKKSKTKSKTGKPAAKKGGNKKGAKKCKKGKTCKKGINLKKLPIGLNYLPAKGNNVYVRTINFYIRLLKMIGDKRDFGTLSKKVSRTCNNFNIFKHIRESVLNCRVIAKRLKNDRSVIKTFYMGCMANIFRLVKNKCPKVFDKKTSARNLNAAIIKLTRVDKRFKRRFQVDANIFVKKLSFFTKIFSGIIQKRLIYMNKLKAIQDKKDAIKRAKMLKLMQIKKAKMEKLKKANKGKGKGKKAAKGKKGKGKAKKGKKAPAKKGKKAPAKKKGKGKGKKGKGKGKGKKAAKGKKGKGKKGKGKGKKGKKTPAKKVLKCAKKCKKGTVCKKTCKKTIVGKFTIKKNTKADKKFAKEFGLSSFKAQTIASLIGKWAMQIVTT